MYNFCVQLIKPLIGYHVHPIKLIVAQLHHYRNRPVNLKFHLLSYSNNYCVWYMQGGNDLKSTSNPSIVQ